jgi:hypothetical protein
MIKAAVSRQREFLADASAVQFTRNPQGIADALRTIGGLTIGSRMLAHNAVEFSHAFFADGVPRFMQAMFATHPPLAERIRRVDPRWDGSFIKPAKTDSASATKRETDSVVSAMAQEQINTEPANLEQALQQAGSPTPGSVLQAQQLLAKIPDALRLEAAEPFGARAVIYALLLDKTFEIRVKQLELLQRKAEREVFQVLNRFMEELDKLEEHARLALVDLSMPALKQLSNQQYQVFRDNISALAEADGKLDLLEWSLGKILFNHLDRHFYNQPQVKRNIHSIRRIQLEVELLISLLAISGHSDKSEADKAYQSSMNELGLPTGPMIESKRITGARLNQALLKAQQLTMPNQQTLLHACIHCVEYDQEVTAKEVEIVRAFSAAMDCPIPLFARANQTGKHNSKQAPPRSPD